MSESETTQAPQETATETKEPEVTLDDVYKDAGLDKIVETQTQPQVQQQTQIQETRQEPSKVPDPYDTEAFKAYVARLEAGTTALHQNQARIAEYVTRVERDRAKSALESDIKSAVETVNEVVNHPKPKVIEAMLDAEARENPKFKALWENRTRNPAAWESALKVTAKKFSEYLSVRVDPNLVAAQRARKDSQKQMATTDKEAPDSSWDNLKQDEFEAKWNQMVSGGH